MINFNLPLIIVCLLIVTGYAFVWWINWNLKRQDPVLGRQSWILIWLFMLGWLFWNIMVPSSVYRSATYPHESLLDPKISGWLCWTVDVLWLSWMTFRHWPKGPSARSEISKG